MDWAGTVQKFESVTVLNTLSYLFEISKRCPEVGLPDCTSLLCLLSDESRTPKNSSVPTKIKKRNSEDCYIFKVLENKNLLLLTFEKY